MELFIDTSDRAKVIVGINGILSECITGDSKSQVILPFIIKSLKKAKVNWEDITRIKFNAGPGSFTGLRVGLAVANTIAWNYKIPVNGKKVWEGEVVELNYV